MEEAGSPADLRDDARRSISIHRHLAAARASLCDALAGCVESAAATVEPASALGGLYPTDYARIRLRDCVRDYTMAVRALGETPEYALKQVKRIIAVDAPVVEPYSALAGDMSQWCIEAYFERA